VFKKNRRRSEFPPYHAADMVKNYDPKTTKTPIDYAFDILSTVAHASFTQWRIVYDIADLSIYPKVA